MDYQLLKELIEVQSPSGSEYVIKEFILSYIDKNKSKWSTQPDIIKDGIQDCIILVFGEPKTAVYAHMDSIGFMVGYDNALSKIGGPDSTGDWLLVGEDSKGEVEGSLMSKNEDLRFHTTRKVDRGTTLTFKPDFVETDNFIQSPYIDNRLGVWIALKLCETLENGAIVFSTFEEHKGGSVQFLAGKLFYNYNIQQSLISDITWVTDGIHHGKGTAISLKDGSVPRRAFTNRIVKLAQDSAIPFQLEVESAGGSDGTAIQHSPYPIDWCFIGAPESNVHSPLEKVHKEDIKSMLELYKYLMKNL
ncbi:MAG: M20/M25/M40 family metallo-hydrolase [Bacteroidia bacterium]